MLSQLSSAQLTWRESTDILIQTILHFAIDNRRSSLENTARVADGQEEENCEELCSFPAIVVVVAVEENLLSAKKLIKYVRVTVKCASRIQKHGLHNIT